MSVTTVLAANTAELYRGSTKIGDLRNISVQRETKEIRSGFGNKILRTVAASKLTWQARTSILTAVALPLHEELNIRFGPNSCLIGCWVTGIDSTSVTGNGPFCTVAGWAAEYIMESEPVAVPDPNKPNPRIVKELVDAARADAARAARTPAPPKEKKRAVPTFPLNTKRHIDFED